MKYSNPRMSFTVDDWPYGSSRVKAVFTVEQDKKGERVSRVTNNPKGGVNKPKKLTYSLKQRIVDGDDEKTYIACLSHYGINIMNSDMKYQHEYAGGYGDTANRYNELMALFS